MAENMIAVCLRSRKSNRQKIRGGGIITGASEDLMEFDGAMDDEGGCFDGGKVFFSQKAVWNGEDDKSVFPNCIEAIWCGKEALDENGNVIPWTYKTDIPHETFMVYEDGEPYCRGIVLSMDDLKEGVLRCHAHVLIKTK